ncbi:MAG: hypothetical protein IJ728_01550 [Selenomonadaceae bacterium]|nr:hypothetical protein [Selenomonadaceae bacterium]
MCVWRREKEKDYGTSENNFKTIAHLWNIYLESAHPDAIIDHINAKDVAMMMALLKIARIASGNNPDSFVDLAGLQLVPERLQKRSAKL